MSTTTRNFPMIFNIAREFFLLIGVRINASNLMRKISIMMIWG